MKPLPVIAALLAGVLLAPIVTVVPAAEVPSGDIAPEQVRLAIKRAGDFLKKQQRNDGSWGEYRGQPGGVTSLCTLALLNAGVPRDDEHIQKALSRLEKLKSPRMVYATSLQTMVFCLADPIQYKPQIRLNVEWLEANQIKSGTSEGGWSYPGTGSLAMADNSNSQFALLALHEAERIGVPVKRETWTRAKAYWEDCQNPLDGSWGYRKGIPGTGSMTCAGISALIISSDRFRQTNAKVEGNQVLCCQATAAGDEDRIQRGLAWLGRNFTVSGNPGSAQLWQLYYLYGLERVGRLTNQRFFYDQRRQPHDWYRRGAQQLVAQQDNIYGSWTAKGYVEEDKTIGTALGLLFMSKGRRPILMAKCQHSVEDDWNAHRSDVDNLTQYVESQWKREMTWQVTDLAKSSVEDLLQAPVLYFYGSLNPLPADPVQKQQLARKLRDYLDRGGFLFAEGYSADFDRGFRELMQAVFANEKEYTLQTLPPEHPIWSVEKVVPPEQLRPLEGIEFGCRTSVVYARPEPLGRPQPSLSCLWELARATHREEYPAAVRAKIDAALAIGINVLAYATNRELEGKEATFRTPAEKKPDAKTERGWIAVAKIQHPGGCNAAPRALANLLEAAGQEVKVRAKAREQLLRLTDEALFDYHLVVMNGRNAFNLTEKERAALKTYIEERGGILFADSICTNRAFTESFRRAMKETFGEGKLVRIPPDDPIWSARYGGAELKTVTRRDPPSGGNGPVQPILRKVPVELEGIKIDNRWVVVFSQYDISCALERHESLECHGYVRKDAARIALNVLLYSLQQ